MKNLPAVPTKAMIVAFIKTNYNFSHTPTHRSITPYEISDDLFIQYGYRFYAPEIRNIMKAYGFETIKVNDVNSYYLN